MSTNPTRSERKPIMPNKLTAMAATAARRAAPVFVANNWHYGGGPGNPPFVPDVAYLAASLAAMLEHAASADVGSTSSGRFTVTRWYEEGDPQERAEITLTLADTAPKANPS